MKKSCFFIYFLVANLLSVQAFSKNSENVLEFENSVNKSQKLKNQDYQKIEIFDFNPVLKRTQFSTIIEFNDLSCQKCLQKAEDFYAKIDKLYMDNIQIVYKHYNHEEIWKVSNKPVYGMLANDLGKFWTLKSQLAKTNLEKNEELVKQILKFEDKEHQVISSLKQNESNYYENIDKDRKSIKFINDVELPVFYIDGYRVTNNITFDEINSYLATTYKDYLKKEEAKNNIFNMGKF